MDQRADEFARSLGERIAFLEKELADCKKERANVEAELERLKEALLREQELVAFAERSFSCNLRYLAARELEKQTKLQQLQQRAREVGDDV